MAQVFGGAERAVVSGFGVRQRPARSGALFSAPYTLMVQPLATTGPVARMLGNLAARTAPGKEHYKAIGISIPAARLVPPSRRRYLRTGGKSVQLPCATSAAIPMLSPSVGCG